MGRPYADEMTLLRTSYAAACKHDWSGAARSVAANVGRTLLAVGSGGSMTTAAWAVALHHLVARGAAHTVTPLALRSAIPTGGNAAVWLMSGSGRNPDILAAFDVALAAEPHELLVLCASTSNPLLDRAALHPWVKSLTLKNPAGSDGFLATNSLFASCVGLAKAYGEGSEHALPESLDELIATASPQLARGAEALEEICRPLWEQETLIVLHGNVGAVAATDIESRFTEAALGCVQIADFRNFAHGRHHWLAKRGNCSAVLSISDSETKELADRTLRLLPDHISKVRIDLDGSPVRAGLAALWFAMQLAGFAGRHKRLDPGRPGVPEFGRRIYNLKTRPREQPSTMPLEIRRKLGDTIAEGASTLSRWKQAYMQARETLAAAEIDAVVLDYDGTLVDPELRRSPPKQHVVEQLERLVKLGVCVGIATGRGDSVRRDMRDAISPKLWRRIIVGYHNGAEIGSLNDDGVPPDASPTTLLREVFEALKEAPFADLLRIRIGSAQVTVESSAFGEEQVWRLVHDVAQQRHGTRLKVVRSSHSVDVIEATTSKTRVLDYLIEKQIARRGTILCIGDRGRWPGNDYELLDHALGISVDEVSSRHDACWNFSKPGDRGPIGASSYLASIKLTGRARSKHARFVFDDAP